MTSGSVMTGSGRVVCVSFQTWPTASSRENAPLETDAVDIRHETDVDRRSVGRSVAGFRRQTISRESAGNARRKPSDRSGSEAAALRSDPTWLFQGLHPNREISGHSETSRRSRINWARESSRGAGPVVLSPSISSCVVAVSSGKLRDGQFRVKL